MVRRVRPDLFSKKKGEGIKLKTEGISIFPFDLLFIPSFFLLFINILFLEDGADKEVDHLKRRRRRRIELGIYE